MVFEHLKVKPGMRIVSAWGNAIVDAIEMIYGMGINAVKYDDLRRLPSDIVPDADGVRSLGTGARAWRQVHAHYGYFKRDLFVQGRRVIKDGDPVTVADLGDQAVSDVTAAIDSARISRLANIRIDEYGNVGVVIAEPLDSRGRVRTVVEDAFEPVSAGRSVSAAENAYGVELVLETGGRPNVNVYYRLGGAGTVEVYVSNDMVTWRRVDVITLSAAGEGFKVYQGIAFRYVKVSVPTAGISVELEVAASR